MFRKMYDWVMRLAASRHAPRSLAAISFAESSFFPIPPDVMLGPMVLARPNKAFLYAAICTLASVAGGMFGYGIGFFLEPVGVKILEIFGHPEGEAEFKALFDRFGVAFVVLAGFTPIPYKLITISSGMANFDLLTFIWASAASRGARFFAVAAILKYLGPAMLQEFERRLTLYTIVLLILAVGGILVLKVFL
ncbi:YqaA family protein [Phenylobacterium sp.]|uniref:YqaA family protein n=1 Tax=Phenylobacterium sp. TaxID=1871053 RepID=UPI002FE0128A